MNGQSESEQFRQFQNRLSQWIGSQGFWFQLRYSMAGSGGQGSFAFHFFRLFTKALLFVVIAIVIAGAAVMMSSDSQSFKEDVADSIEKRINADEVEVSGFSVSHGELRLSSMAAAGSGETFFQGLSARNVRCRMGMLDRFKPGWKAGVLEISNLELDLNAGADNEADAKTIGQVIFAKDSKAAFEGIRVARADIRWGYSVRTRGSIENSEVKAQRVGDGWRVRFRGGQFSQNWLKDLKILQLDVLITPGKILFEKAQFKNGRGDVSFDGLEVQTGDRPQLNGAVKFSKIAIEPLLPLAIQDYFEGLVSGEFQVFGSLNSSDGIGFDGEVKLDDGDYLVIRDNIHILRALSVVDAFNNYRRISFESGSFRMKSFGEEIEISDLFLIAGNSVTLDGGVDIRVPTPEEVIQFQELINENETVRTIVENLKIEEQYNLTLGRAAKVAAGDPDSGFEQEEESSLYKRLGLSEQTWIKDRSAAEMRFRTFQYNGEFALGLPADAFKRAPALDMLYKKRSEDGRIIIDVPIEGTLYQATLEQAEEMYRLGAR